MIYVRCSFGHLWVQSTVHVANSCKICAARKMRLFTMGKKLKMIAEAKAEGNCVTDRKYDLSESCIQDWRKNKDELQNCLPNHLAFWGKRLCIQKWKNSCETIITSKQQFCYTVSTEMCQLQAIEINKKLGINRQNFKASRGWLQWFKTLSLY